MAYCKSCGAYIPDGQAVCLACGFDPASEKKPETSKPKTESSAAYQASQASENNEEMRRRLEEQRRRAREQNLQWADQEKRRREEQAAREAARKEQQEKARREAEAEYARRKAEQAAQQAAQQSAQNDAPYGAAAGQGNKALAALSYLSILFLAPSIFAPQDKFACYHARQGMKLFIFGIVADLLAAMIGIGWVATLARLYLMYKGITNALNYRMEPLPYIGTIGDK